MDRYRRDGLIFDVLEHGAGDGPVVVLLHGFPQFADSWSPVADRLAADGYRCMAPNQRGYSSGARPRGRSAYRIGHLVADVAALVDAAGATRIHLVGHDWGAAVAWAFAARYPYRLASVAAFSVPHPAALARALVTSRQAWASWYMLLFQPPRLPESVLLHDQRLEKLLVRSGQTPAAAARDSSRMAEPGALTAALNWYRAIGLSTPRATRAKVHVPTLFVWSDRDSAILRTTAERCREWVDGPYTFETLTGVSHWIPEQAPDDAAHLLLQHFHAHPA